MVLVEVVASVKLLYAESHGIYWTDLDYPDRLPPLLDRYDAEVLGIDYHYRQRTLYFSSGGQIWRSDKTLWVQLSLILTLVLDMHKNDVFTKSGQLIIGWEASDIFFIKANEKNVRLWGWIDVCVCKVK